MGHIRRRKLDHGCTAYLARYRGPDGRERSKQFAKRADAERYLSAAEVTKAEGSWIDPARGRMRLREWLVRFQESERQALRPQGESFGRHLVRVGTPASVETRRSLARRRHAQLERAGARGRRGALRIRHGRWEALMAVKVVEHWSGRHPAVQKHMDNRTFGEKAADVMRSGMGTWTFIIVFLAAMMVWALVNTIFKVGHSLTASGGFDPYPYILLNLVLSTIAGLQAAALLIAAKRSDHLAAIVAEQTVDNTEDLKKSLAQNTALTEDVHKNAQLIRLLAAKAGITAAEMAAAISKAEADMPK